MSTSDFNSLPANVFRANVGAIIFNSNGDVLALERSDVKGAWQLPQGGLKEEEEPLDAILREIREETNIDKSQLEFVSEYPEWLAYELAKNQRTGKHGRGQVQKWFLFRFKGHESDINLNDVEDKEFSSWKWMSLKQLAKETVSFRQRVYQKLAEGFSQYLKN